ncbi:hypothetical protein DIPPA_08289 [Diplonema papillatum]|nr:hypothetical protein DIPPA_08289 [Diplonema papillatum]
MHAIRAAADLPRNQISRLRISEGIRGPPPHANQCDLTPCEKRSCEFVYARLRHSPQRLCCDPECPAAVTRPRVYPYMLRH